MLEKAKLEDGISPTRPMPIWLAFRETPNPNPLFSSDRMSANIFFQNGGIGIINQEQIHGTLLIIDRQRFTPLHADHDRCGRSLMRADVRSSETPLSNLESWIGDLEDFTRNCWEPLTRVLLSTPLATENVRVVNIRSDSPAGF
jgi:hypothetical protein